MNGKAQRIEVQDQSGSVLGHVERNVRTAHWRTRGVPPPPVWIGGKQLPLSIRGCGREAVLVVRLAEGMMAPDDLQPAGATGEETTSCEEKE